MRETKLAQWFLSLYIKTVPTLDLDKLVVQLAERFKQRGMHKHVDELRVWYRGYRARSLAALREKKPPWTEALVLDWLCILAVPPFENVLPVLAQGARACTCTENDAGLPAVACVFPPNGVVWECARCGSRWVEKEER